MSQYVKHDLIDYNEKFVGLTVILQISGIAKNQLYPVKALGGR